MIGLTFLFSELKVELLAKIEYRDIWGLVLDKSIHYLMDMEKQFITMEELKKQVEALGSENNQKTKFSVKEWKKLCEEKRLEAEREEKLLEAEREREEERLEVEREREHELELRRIELQRARLEFESKKQGMLWNGMEDLKNRMEDRLLYFRTNGTNYIYSNLQQIIK